MAGRGDRPGVVLGIVLVVLTLWLTLITAGGVVGLVATAGSFPAAADSPLSTAQAFGFMAANAAFGVTGLVGLFFLWNARDGGLLVTILALLGLFAAQLWTFAAAAPRGFRAGGGGATTLIAAVVLTAAFLWDRRRQ